VSRRSSASALAETLSALPGQSREALTRQYKELFGSDVPKNMSRPLLAMAIGYRLQEQHYGGLKPWIRRSLLSGAPSRLSPTTPGTVLIREWHGQHHRVVVHPNDVEYGGERFRSLSEVARVITGHKRSGPLFFGLKGGADVQ
jgi:hypothetical protein